MKKCFLTRLFYKGKYYKKEEKDNLTAMLLPSILGIILCAVCLMGSTWAWFTATQSTGTQTIQAANYEVSAVIKLNDTEIAANNGTYTLAAGTYTVTLTASGDATTGYCVLDFSTEKAYTEQIPKGTSITLTLNMNDPATLEITAVWGTYAGDGKISAEYTYGTASIAEDNAQNEDNNDNLDVTDPTKETTSPTEETTTPETPTEHTVISGDALSSIASKYNTTVAKLAAYNNIEDVNEIQVGDVIKIPPADYVIPETTEITDPPQQTEEATEPSETDNNEVPTTEPEVTAPPETEGNTGTFKTETTE